MGIYIDLKDGKLVNVEKYTDALTLLIMIFDFRNSFKLIITIQ